METIYDTIPIPIINGCQSKNERHHPGWTAAATKMFLDHLSTAINPITVEDVRAANPHFDAVTARISGWGAIPIRLKAKERAIKVGLRLRDNEGVDLRHTLGLWWHPHAPFSTAFVEKVGKLLTKTHTVEDLTVDDLVEGYRKMPAPKREAVFNAMAQMEAAA